MFENIAIVLAILGGLILIVCVVTKDPAGCLIGGGIAIMLMGSAFVIAFVSGRDSTVLIVFAIVGAGMGWSYWYEKKGRHTN